MKDNIVAGLRFGKLTVVREGKKLTIPCGQTNRTALCKCDCGKTKTIRWLHLKRKRISSCGCLHERHGMVGERIYRIWRGVINRCSDKYPEKHLYYDKGITICKEWSESFIKFRNWAFANGYEHHLTIDRENNSKGYYPENCRWVTQIQNANNRDKTFFIIYEGKKVAFMEILREKNLLSFHPAIRSRIKRGWNPQKAIDTKIRKGNYKRANVTYTMKITVRDMNKG